MLKLAIFYLTSVSKQNEINIRNEIEYGQEDAVV